MSKLARYRRKVYRHRLDRTMEFSSLKKRVTAANRKVNISTLAMYWKYIHKNDPTLTLAEWRGRVTGRRRDFRERRRRTC